MGYALRLSAAPEQLEQRSAWLDDHRRLLAASRVERFAYAEVIAKDKDALRRELNYSGYRSGGMCSCARQARLLR